MTYTGGLHPTSYDVERVGSRLAEQTSDGTEEKFLDMADLRGTGIFCEKFKTVDYLRGIKYLYFTLNKRSPFKDKSRVWTAASQQH